MSQKNVLTRLAPAKVNLFLHVGPVQANSRHPLESLVAFADAAAADTVSVSLADDLTLTLSGPGRGVLEAEDDNLVLAAARQLSGAVRRDPLAAIKLDKQLPIAAGIGGGSADAAAALALLTKLWDLYPRVAPGIAWKLGGDVPVALAGEWAMMRGEGERVDTLDWSFRLPALLVNPNVPCPTGPVFRAFDTAGGGSGFAETVDLPECANIDDVLGWLAECRNDLEAPAIDLVPEIGEVLTVLQALKTARLCRMSGSGATCFALFGSVKSAKVAARQLASAHPDWWVRATVLGRAPR